MRRHVNVLGSETCSSFSFWCLCASCFFFTLPLTADATKLRIRHVAATPTVAAPRSHHGVPQGCPEATFNFLWPFNLSLTIYKVCLACNFSIRSLFSSVLMCVYGGLWVCMSKFTRKISGVQGPWGNWNYSLAFANIYI